MFKFILKRCIGLIPVGFGVVTIVCLLIHITPGDPVDHLLGDYATEQEKAVLRHDLGLDKPIPLQLVNYFKGLAHLNLGKSLIYNKQVYDLIFERLQATIELAFLAMLWALLLSIPLGIISALNKGKVLDGVSMLLALIGVALPNFWLGPMYIWLFSLKLGWFPVSERGSWESYILPTITLGTGLIAILSRMTRNAMLEILKEDYVRTARAKGNSEFIVVLKHTLRNAALPLVSIVGLQFGVLLTGAVITEKIFDWPGLGSLMLEALGNRDYPLVQGCVLFFACSYLFVNLITDIVYTLVDPRIKYVS